MKTGMNWDDIVFEKRNREYGTYQFRKSYSRSVVTGMLTALFVLMAICSYPMISSLLNGNKPKTIVPKHIENSILMPPPPIDRDVVVPPKINSLTLNDACDDEAIRLIKSMPKWTPAVRDGHPVKTQMLVPVMYKVG